MTTRKPTEQKKPLPRPIQQREKPTINWDAVIKRFKADMNRRYRSRK